MNERNTSQSKASKGRGNLGRLLGKSNSLIPHLAGQATQCITNFKKTKIYEINITILIRTSETRPGEVVVSSVLNHLANDVAANK